ncbi:carbon-nitrogen hydrolase family protein [Sulfitobacter sp. S190]|uniref:carbon-nitrogen hydrolase family protein n=1 Tax=Sulfitobacter sp. S190 TaxID=2867022 RepID=UPI0021A8A715|nr:carbon-nitrogen hydrolase family protein [Sulfitobacter sp. S190]UWR22142.1 carbon-nitrogen hydrolase family protein [Sulfitobacter sp. S190]
MKLALWQTLPQSDIATALQTLGEAAKEAAANGADLLVTPEMYVGGYNIGAANIAAHADQSAQVLDDLKEIARTHDIGLIVGLTLPGQSRPYNACIAVDATGLEVARYHKTHLFGDVDRAQFSQGAALSDVFELNGWNVALAICYDVEFPEVTRALALQGAEIVVTPTANMAPFDSVATRLVPARAEENGLYVAYCNYVGSEGQFTYNGLSCLVGPDGEDRARGADAPTLLYATLDRAALVRARQAQTHLADRRANFYKDIL